MQNIAVLFGGKSPEHEVSIITGIQVIHALKKAGFNALPIYVTKKGEWVVGDKSFEDPKTFSNQEKAVYKKTRIIIPQFSNDKKIIESPPLFSLIKTLQSFEVDCFFPCFHGRYGEGGAVQGLLELSNIPYVGTNTEASAVSIDKVLSKKIAKSIGIPVLPDIWITKNEIDKIPKIKCPAFVKPAHLGSSIGVKKVNNQKELKEALEVAFFYDTKVMIEEALQNAKEINISIMGNNPYEVSPTEQPISSDDILSFEDKYISKEGKGSKGMATAKRIIPAPIKISTQKLIENYSKMFFAEIDGTGLARIDYLVSKDEKKIYFNEINTIPGSYAYYLWQKKGIGFEKLVKKLVDLAIEKHEENSKITTTFKSNILENYKEGSNKLKI